MKNKIETILHYLIIITTTLAIGSYFIPSFNSLGGNGIECFKYFTTDSNVLAILASLFCLISKYKNKEYKWVKVFQFIATISVTLTFLTVVFFLSPMNAIKDGIKGYFLFFSNEIFVLHFSTPVLSIIALLLSNNKYNKNICLYSLLPTLLYSIIYLINVAIIGIWNDWYGFTFGGQYNLIPIVLLVMYGFTYLIAFIEYKINNKIVTKIS